MALGEAKQTNQLLSSPQFRHRMTPGIDTEGAHVELAKSMGNESRNEFISRLTMGPPQQFRVIECKSTIEEQRVVLLDWHEGLQVTGYTAVSHTYGMEVYSVFDCECTTKCLAKVPRCSGKPCPGHGQNGSKEHWKSVGDCLQKVCFASRDLFRGRGRKDKTHWKIVGDILKMCQVLMAAGAEYVWHDGVCIAQHNQAEVEDSIKHMGWIYANAKDTVIFPHYVGSFMAPIRHDGDLVSRWQTRVWTLQEAAVSRCRRYCVRVSAGVDHCQSLQELEGEVANWYKDESNIAVIEEDLFWQRLVELRRVLERLLEIEANPVAIPVGAGKWLMCIDQWIETLLLTCFMFPSVEDALHFCSRRDSKHEGDRINSILALAGVTDFVAPKDDNVEASTMEFFKRQGQRGLALAVFSCNSSPVDIEADRKRHSWVPSLSKRLLVPMRNSIPGFEHLFAMQCTNFLHYELLWNGTIQLTGHMACILAHFTPKRSGGGALQAFGQPMMMPKHQNNVAIAVDELAMDLCFSSACYIALAHASSLELGKAFIPWRLVIDGTSKNPQAPVFNAPVIMGREIQDGESFSGHLLFPVAGLSHKPNPKSAHVQDMASMPALLVTGDFQSQVRKLGSFQVFAPLKDILLKNLTHATMLEKLVIV